MKKASGRFSEEKLRNRLLRRETEADSTPVAPGQTFFWCFFFKKRTVCL
jgi:hypothetical protein